MFAFKPTTYSSTKWHSHKNFYTKGGSGRLVIKDYGVTTSQLTSGPFLK